MSGRSSLWWPTGAAGPSTGGQSASKGSGSNKGSSNAGASGSASDGGKGKSGQGGSSGNGAGATGAAGPSRSDGSPSSPAAAGGMSGVSAATSNPTRQAVPSPVMPGPAIRRAIGQGGERVSLPGRLRPERGSGRVLSRQATHFAVTRTFGMFAFPALSPMAVCREAVISAAVPLGASQVRVGGAGPVRRRGQLLSAPINVSIRYPREVRQARIECRLNSTGTVIGLR